MAMSEHVTQSKRNSDRGFITVQLVKDYCLKTCVVGLEAFTMNYEPEDDIITGIKANSLVVIIVILIFT